MSSRNKTVKTVVPKTAEEIASIAYKFKAAAAEVDGIQIFRADGLPMVGGVLPKGVVYKKKSNGCEQICCTNYAPSPPPFFSQERSLRDLYEDSIAPPPVDPEKWILVVNKKGVRKSHSSSRKQKHKRDDFPVIY
jgi:hypothetical protein